MTNKAWFQWGVGILLALLIIKFFLEVHWLLNPLVAILKAVAVPLLIGGVLFYITLPVQTFLEKRGIPRWGSIVIILILLTGLFTSFVWVVGEPISEQVNNLVKATPSIASDLQRGIDYLIDVVDNKADFPPQVESAIDNISNSIQDYAIALSTWLVSALTSVVTATLAIIIVPFFFVFMLKDHEKLAPFMYQFFAGERREWIKRTLEDINETIRSYVQGQILVSFILALIILAGYSLIGLEYTLILVILSFFMNLIPFIGPWISFIPAVIVGLIQDPSLVIWVAVINLVAQQLESNLITPNVMGKSLELHPLTVITVILAAGNLGGFVAIILAVPVYAVIKVIVSNLYEERKLIQKTASKKV
ncbi:MAG: AI-2E family transporter [Caryophanon sp.]|nr:AI-2E family transporter [Caryophanon sp.]